MWLGAGIVLLLIELATPTGFFVLFFGLGAVTVGLLQAMGLLTTAVPQWLLFSAISVIYLLLFRGRMQKGIDRAPGNIDTLVGELAVPHQPIAPGHVGRVELRGTMWDARNDAPRLIEAGQRCRVTAVDGLMVYVQPE